MIIILIRTENYDNISALCSQVGIVYASDTTLSKLEHSRSFIAYLGVAMLAPNLSYDLISHLKKYYVIMSEAL